MDWTKEDFEDGSAPYESIYELEDPFQRQQAINRMASYAKTVGVKNFLKLYQTFEQSVRKPKGYSIVNHSTYFDGQPMELDSGGWTADESGVYKEGSWGERLYACTHPVMPVERLVNIDTGEEKLRIAYRKGKAPWRNLIADKRTLASASKVTELAGSGISVTSDNAKQFIRYIFELESLNYDLLPVKNCVGRLGYLPGIGFSPYVKDLLFDGNESFKNLFETIKAKGRYDGEGEDNWRYIAQWCRRNGLVAKILLAASFASPLLNVLGALPFFVHVWAVESGTNKTVALMLAASVWGDPELGHFTMTFCSTDVGHELTAAFLNHLPLCLDELQLTKDSRGRSNFDVYKLAQGVGKMRGNRSGGVNRTPTWKNCILTTGESPIVGLSSGAGAVNRVVEVECTPGDPALPSGCGMWASGILKRNYGHAGKRFVERLYRDEETAQRVRELYDGYFQALSAQDTTEKQAVAAAAILTGDTLACEWIFDGTEKPITVEEISAFLASKASVSLGQRAYDFLLDWVAMNKVRFQLDGDVGEIWGLMSGDRVYIIKSKFQAVLEENGYSCNSVLSWLAANQKLADCGKDKKRRQVKKYINGMYPWCVCLKIN